MKNEILKEIGEALKKAIGAGCDVWFDKIEKNNGVMLQSVTIREFGNMVASRINVDEMISMLEAGAVGFHDVVDCIVDTYKAHRNMEYFYDMMSSLSKEKILQNVIYQIVNKKKNEKRLLMVPGKDVLDLVAMYRVVISDNGQDASSFIVDYEICSKYGISKEELDAAAMKNTKRNGFVATSITSILSKIMEMPEELFVGNEPPMYVITNKRGLGGASVMIYPEEFRKAALLLHDDLYVLPSSINEVIVVPATGTSPDELAGMVEQINTEELRDEEFLSNSIYRYDMADGSLRIVQEKE